MRVCVGPRGVALPPGGPGPDQQTGEPPGGDAAREPRPVQPGPAPAGGCRRPAGRGLRGGETFRKALERLRGGGGEDGMSRQGQQRERETLAAFEVLRG